ncbi:hypothetical protein [Klebsiella pneumoniae IS46]|nr:hypothetical protein BN426_2401 [Klebsiella pneumoniae subsp. pneumoniae ST258-K26BO]CDK60708.1 hypothetical protein [Klebsiella pneumoniae IS10]CDL14384.1 hypothetical protein [Klebsiella pneumoniae IS46]SSM44148.1 Uncharacterised protein [Klebsiella pneumoniae]
MVDDIALRFIGRKAHCLRAVARDRQQGNHRLMDFTAVVHAAAAQYHTNFFHRFRSSMQLAETSQKCRLTRYASHILLIHVTN